MNCTTIDRSFFYFVKGNDVPVYIEVIGEDEDGVEFEIDITGGTLLFTLKEKSTDDDDDALIKVSQQTHTDPVHGKSYMVLPKEQTADVPVKKGYYWDIKFVSNTGMVSTLIPDGRADCLQDITQRNEP